jgi:8-oxo-dGTP pyrophosphatase MutT (NUDIX family)
MLLKLDTIIERLGVRLEMPLPGEKAHASFRATPIGNLKPIFKHDTPPRSGSVVILLYEEDGRIKFPLIKRPTYNGAHSNQVSLPGGKAEPSESYLQTALRETEEEIGINRHEIRVVGTLSDLLVIPSNFLVTPVIAFAQQPKFVPDQREVVKILHADLNLFLEGKNIREKKFVAPGGFELQTPYFSLEDEEEEMVWGATAMILNEFRVTLLESL